MSSMPITDQQGLICSINKKRACPPPFTRSLKRQKISDHLHNVILEPLIAYLDLKSILNWGRTDKNFEIKILNNKKNFPHAKNASLWLSTCVQRMIRRPHRLINYKMLERLIEIEKDFSAEIFPSSCIPYLRLYLPTPKSQKIIKKIPNLIPNLQKLALVGAEITDKHIKFLNHLPQLQKLTFHSCSQVTKRGLDRLIGSTNLKILRFKLWDEITDADLGCLKDFTALNKLSFFRCVNITGVALAHFKNFTTLNTLNFIGTQVTDAGLACLKNFSLLHTLSLGSTKITHDKLACLKDLMSLHTLDLSNCQIADYALSCLRDCTALRNLNLSDCQFSTLTHLKNFTLHTLSLSDYLFMERHWSYLKNFTLLQSLKLENCSISDAALSHLKNLTSLRTLTFTDCFPVTNAALIQLGMHCQVIID